MDELEPIAENSTELDQFGQSCANALLTISKNAEGKDLHFDPQQVLKNIKTLDDDELFVPSPHETIAYDPQEVNENPLEVDIFNYVTEEHFQKYERTETHISVIELPNGDAKLHYSAKHTSSDEVGYVTFSFTLDSDGSTDAGLMYGTNETPQKTTLLLTVSDTTSFPYSEKELKRTRETTRAATHLFPYAYKLAENSYISHNVALTKLFDDHGFTHTEIGEMLGSSRSTISTHAQKYRQLDETIENEEKKLELTKQVNHKNAVGIEEVIRNRQ